MLSCHSGIPWPGQLYCILLEDDFAVKDRFCSASIGFSIAKKLVSDGANVMVSSRKEQNVSQAVDRIRQEVEGGGKVEGVVCHVGKNDHRKNLVKEVQYTASFQTVEG